MTTDLSWLDALGKIEEYRKGCDQAVKNLQSSIGELVKANTGGDVPQIDRAYAAALTSWSEMLNAADRLAGLGQSLTEKFPDQVRYSVGGTILEVTDNLLDSAAALRAIAGSADRKDPLAYAAEQPLAFQFAQELIAAHFPSEVARFLQKFERLALPIAGLAVTGSARRVRVVPVKHDAAGAIRLLHISDLHRTPDETVTNKEVGEDLLRALADIDKEPIDLILATGDLAQSATRVQYDQFEELLGHLVDKLLSGDKSRCIVVPGNHDVDWDASLKGNFNVKKPENGKDTATMPVGAVKLGGNIVVPTPDLLKKTTKNFRDSYRSFFGREYPADDKKRCFYIEPPHLNVGIVAIDTTIGMSHLCDTAAVERDALIEALALAQANTNRPFIIAVGHHGPIRKHLQSDAIESWVLDRLVGAGVSLYLHGHVHETQLYHHSEDGVSSIACVGVGSLVAGPKQRPESTPRHYHIIELPRFGKRGRVYIRRKAQRDKPWKVCQEYGPKTAPVDYLEFG